MKNLYIIKTGSTFDSTKEKYKDFKDWIIDKLENKYLNIIVIDLQNGDKLPDYDICDGIIITGSHSMVTEEREWSLKLENWLLDIKEKETPLLAICYGHQLLAKALGGISGYHKDGMEIGTVDINLTKEAREDILFKDLAQNFFAHTIHSQTVLKLPDDAISLAFNSHDPNHAYRIGKCMWGVQFHPEFDENSMNSYIKEVTKIKKWDKSVEEKLLINVKKTVEATSLLKRFEVIVRES